MKRLLFGLIFTFCLTIVYAQQNTGNKEIDSLLLTLKTAKEDTNKVNALLLISDKFSNSGDFEVALSYLKNSLDLAKSLKLGKGTVGWNRGIVKAYTGIGSIYYRQGKYALALENLQNNYKIHEAAGDTNGMCKSYGNFAMTYIRQGNYDKAIESYNKVLEMQKARGNKVAMAGCYGNIGQVYTDKGDYAKAMTNIMGSMKLFTSIGDTDGVATSYQAIGNLFFIQDKYDKAIENYFEAIKLLEIIGDKSSTINLNSNIALCYSNQGKYDKALEMHLKSLKISVELGDKDDIAICYSNIGAGYGDLENFDKALKNYFASLKLAEEIDNKGLISSLYSNIAGIYNSQKKENKALEYYLLALKMQEANEDIEETGRTYNLIGNLYLQQGKAGEAKKYLLKSLSALQETGAKNLIKSAYENLALCDSALGDYKGAFEYYKLFKALNDSVFNAESSGKMDELVGKFETEKKEAQIKLLEKEKEKEAAVAKEESRRQQIILYFALGVLILFILFSGFIYNRFKVTQKQKNIIELKERETQQQNLVITEQKHVIEERHKEITDSINYAERIQRSFLATKELLDENLNEYFVLFKPKDIVSGDFYWANKLNNGRFALVTADSTGHGVPGAIMSLLNVTSLETALKEGYKEPADILNSTRKTIIERLKKDGSIEGGKDGMDASLCVYDFRNKKLTIAAANNPVWIVRNQPSFSPGEGQEVEATSTNPPQIIEVKPDKMPIGKHDKDSISFTQQEIDLQPGDVIYTLTDGFPDQFGGLNGKKFMSKNLRELLAANAHLPMQEQKALLEKTFANWVACPNPKGGVGNMEQVDDVCLIGVRV